MFFIWREREKKRGSEIERKRDLLQPVLELRHSISETRVGERRKKMKMEHKHLAKSQSYE